MANLMPLERIQQRIYWIRGQKVMLSPDLGELYGVEPRVISKKGRAGVRHAPYAFTEQGVAMLSSEADADIGSTQKLLGLARLGSCLTTCR
ncbi:MAG: ORF6N domain-containing protein [Gemmatimonadales bacterium]|nr:ORF6N domain-containing protein [Gemmatimonadales bacterium]